MSSETLTAESAATVAEVAVLPGDRVAAGGLLLVTELMKMRHEIRAARVEAAHVARGAASSRVTSTPGEKAVDHRARFLTEVE